MATDSGIMHRMRQLAPGKTLIEAPTAGNSATCKSCAHCPWMAMNVLQGVADCLEKGTGEVHVDICKPGEDGRLSTACWISSRRTAGAALPGIPAGWQA